MPRLHIPRLYLPNRFRGDWVYDNIPNSIRYGAGCDKPGAIHGSGSFRIGSPDSRVMYREAPIAILQESNPYTSYTVYSGYNFTHDALARIDAWCRRFSRDKVPRVQVRTWRNTNCHNHVMLGFHHVSQAGFPEFTEHNYLVICLRGHATRACGGVLFTEHLDGIPPLEGTSLLTPDSNGNYSLAPIVTESDELARWFAENPDQDANVQPVATVQTVHSVVEVA